MTDIKTCAIEIIDAFEELLEEHEIYIPDEYREGNPSEACIYGATYGDLQDEIIGILEKYKDGE